MAKAFIAKESEFEDTTLAVSLSHLIFSEISFSAPNEFSLLRAKKNNQDFKITSLHDVGEKQNYSAAMYSIERQECISNKSTLS